ncbi:hypothetical protein P692DRAFT_20700839, partial [Suillus brevipes Sb2]
MPGGPSIKRTTRSTNVILTSSEIEAQASTVNDATSAHLYLKKKSLCHATEPYTINHLISVLLQITQISGSTPLPVLTAIISVIFLLKQHETDEIAEAVATQVSTSVTQNISDSITTKLVDHVIATIAPQIARILTASESLEHAAQKETEQLRKLVENRIDLDRDIDASEDRITLATDTLLCAIEDCQNSIDLVTPSLETTQQRLNTLSLQFLTQ